MMLQIPHPLPHNLYPNHHDNSRNSAQDILQVDHRPILGFAHDGQSDVLGGRTPGELAALVRYEIDDGVGDGEDDCKGESD